MNHIILIGRLTRDPELKYTQAGKAYVKVGLAVNRDFKNDKGEYEADFINLVAWDKKAELIAEYLKKGHRVGFTGKLRVRQYEDENKKNVTASEVQIESVEFLESKGKEQETNNVKNDTKLQDMPSGDDDFPF